MTRTFDDVRKRASLATKVVSLCLAGELVEQLAGLERQLAAAPAPTNLEEVSPKRAIAEQIVALQDEMRESTVDFHLKALPTRQWAVMFAGQPQRIEGESAEDWEPRMFAFQAQVVSMACVDPEMSAEQVGELVDLLHFQAWLELYKSAYLLNMNEVDVPNSEAASELTRDSGQT